jgi:hypothetical protein
MRAERNHGNTKVIGDIVTVIAQRGWKEGQQPDTSNAEFFQIVELSDEAPEVADAVVIVIE